MLEDLHWIDSESQSLLDRVIESLPTARILLRGQLAARVRARLDQQELLHPDLAEPLAPGLAQALLDTLLGGDPALDALKGRLIERTEGNPFFLEESVWHLAETGALAGARGAYRLARPIRDVQVPATVHAVLAARIDRLPAPEKRLLQAAAVIGKDVPLLCSPRSAISARTACGSPCASSRPPSCSTRCPCSPRPSTRSSTR